MRPDGLYRVNEDLPSDALLRNGELVQVHWVDDNAWATSIEDNEEWFVDSCYLDGPVEE